MSSLSFGVYSFRIKNQKNQREGNRSIPVEV